MQDALDAIDRMVESFEKANEALDGVWPILEEQKEINGKVAATLGHLDELDDCRATDIDELREGVAALSNRLESLTRYVMDGGVHSVKA